MANADRAATLAALAAGGFEAWENAGAPFCHDREFILQAVRFHPEVLRVASTFRNDQRVALAAVESHPGALWWLCGALKNDPETVLAAVSQDGDMLVVAGTVCRSDPRVVLAAIRQNPLALRHAIPVGAIGREICWEAVSRNGLAIASLAARAFRDDPEFRQAAMQSNGMALCYLIDPDDSLVRLALTQNGRALRHIERDLRTVDLCLIAVRQTWEAFISVPHHIKANVDILRAVLEAWPQVSGGQGYSLATSGRTIIETMSGVSIELPDQHSSQEARDVLASIDLAWMPPDTHWRALKLVREGSTSHLADEDLVRLSWEDTFVLLRAGAAGGDFRRVPHYTLVVLR